MTTKREFDAATKENLGTPRYDWSFDPPRRKPRGSSGLASDERSYYRRARMLPDYGSGSTGGSGCTGVDRLAERAADRARNPYEPLRSLRTAPKRFGSLAVLRGADGILYRETGTPDRFDIRDAERLYRVNAAHMRRAG